jgi:hypothetical protein
LVVAVGLSCQHRLAPRNGKDLHNCT